MHANDKDTGRRVTLAVVGGLLLLGLVLAVGAYWGLTVMSVQVGQLADSTAAGDPSWQELLRSWHTRGVVWGAALLAAGVLLTVWLLSWRLRRIVRRPVAPPSTAPAERQNGAQPGRRELQKRVYLHLISVLQREGRLLDFLYEDLDAYEDAQIGAAVRSVHAGCRAALEKHLTPRAVLDTAEGDPIHVPAGFDPTGLKLVGQVSGDPPFKGIVRHRGWRAAKVVLPTLSPAGATDILAPGEVEIG